MKMILLDAPNGHFPSKRTLSGSLLLMLVLLATHTSCISPEDEKFEDLAVGDDYGDIDNVELHHVSIVDGIMHEDHPIIMYKEDFVNEDYDPTKKPNHHRRKYKDIVHHRRRVEHTEAPDVSQYRPLKPEKIYFDVLSSPSTKSAHAPDNEQTNFDPSKLKVEVISLADDLDVNQAAKNETETDATSKWVLNKRPKKYHRRVRRDADDSEHKVEKRNIYYQITKQLPAQPNRNYLPVEKSYTPGGSTQWRYPVAGKKRNGINELPVEGRFGDRKETVIWRDRTPKRDPNERSPATNRPPLPLFVDDAKSEQPADFESTISRESQAPIFGQAPPPPAPPATRVPDTSRKFMSLNCTWAIANCCSNQDTQVRYSCFERFMCTRIFWDLNPCGDQLRDSVINFLSDNYD